MKVKSKINESKESELASILTNVAGKKNDQIDGCSYLQIPQIQENWENMYPFIFFALKIAGSVECIMNREQ